MTRKEEIKQMIVAAVRKHLGQQPVRVFIFGSQANLPELKAADIDVGLDAGMPLETNKVFGIHTELNEFAPTLFEFDVVDFADVSEKFRRVASMETETLVES